MIYTIGHSTQTSERFLSLLRAHQIEQLADVRRVPHSRRHPQFNMDALAAFLEGHGLTYRHFPQLGGRRKPRRDSPNTAWREDGFRGYADYMAEREFHSGIESLLHSSEGRLTAIMCAEAVWWKCHRRLLSDALVIRGVPVFHILSVAAPNPHELSEFACVDGDSLTYPGLLR